VPTPCRLQIVPICQRVSINKVVRRIVHIREPVIARVQWVSEKWGTKMANDGVRYLFRGRIADFGRTKTFVAIIAFVFGMTVGHTIANFTNLSRTEAIRAQINELKMRVDSLKVQSDAQKK
jgi:hypothetical protein